MVAAAGRSHLATLLGLVLALVAAPGCRSDQKKTYPVLGTVMMDNQPAKHLIGCTVIFDSAEMKLGAQGVVDGNGTFRLSTYGEDDGAPAGKYRVIITPPDEEGEEPRRRRLFPERYEDYERSGLTAEVEAKTNEISISLKSK